MMLLFFLNIYGGTHERLPCGLYRRKFVELYEKGDSKYLWYDFTVAGKRYRGSTKETNPKRAEAIASLKLAKVLEGNAPLPKKAPVLVNFAERFLKWVESSRL